MKCYALFIVRGGGTILAICYLSMRYQSFGSYTSTLRTLLFSRPSTDTHIVDETVFKRITSSPASKSGQAICHPFRNSPCFLFLGLCLEKNIFCLKNMQHFTFSFEVDVRRNAFCVVGSTSGHCSNLFVRQLTCCVFRQWTRVLLCSWRIVSQLFRSRACYIVMGSKQLSGCLPPP